jgi:CBS domain containing-hemolysin-like protein
LQALLWIIAGLSASGFFVLLNRSASIWLALGGSLLLIWFGFGWLPRTRLTAVSSTLARWFAAPLASLLNYLGPALEAIARPFIPRGAKDQRTGLYQKDDLIDLLKQQKDQPDNRIPIDELEIAVHALTYGDKLVRDIMTPRAKVKTIATNEHIGPVVMSELHDSGHSRFPVYQGKPENIVGTLYLRDLVATKSGGKVSELMSKEVYYVHEEQSLGQALHAFLKTKHHLFIVVNSFEEMVGIMTIEDILKQIVGKPLVEDFDKFDDRKAVAQLPQAKKEPEPHAEKIETEE